MSSGVWIRFLLERLLTVAPLASRSTVKPTDNLSLSDEEYEEIVKELKARLQSLDLLVRNIVETRRKHVLQYLAGCTNRAACNRVICGLASTPRIARILEETSIFFLLLSTQNEVLHHRYYPRFGCRRSYGRT